MIQLDGMISVAEAARRLNRSQEQVRRYLREGKLIGQRLGNQWFVEEKALSAQPNGTVKSRPLIPPETVERVREVRRRINEENRRRGFPPFDVVEMLHRLRDERDEELGDTLLR